MEENTVMFNGSKEVKELREMTLSKRKEIMQSDEFKNEMNEIMDSAKKRANEGFQWVSFSINGNVLRMVIMEELSKMGFSVKNGLMTNITISW